jgi:two-component system, NarL family, sensor kinase
MSHQPPSVTNPPGDTDGATRELPAVAPWVVLTALPTSDKDAEPQPRRIFGLVAVGAVLVFVLVAVVGIIGARKLAEHQAVNDAANRADLLAEAVVQPALRNAIAQGGPAAQRQLAAALKDYLASSDIVRVKVWTRDGHIVYSDEPRLIGQQFTLDEEERQVFVKPRTVAEVSDLDEPENVLERGHGKLLEAYRPVWTPAGTPLLFETYSPYDTVTTRAGQLFRGFFGITLSSLLLLIALLVPLVWQLVTRLRAVQRQREALLERAVEASEDERRRIAGTLHDGVVQELAATSFAVSGAAARAREQDQRDLGDDLETVAATLRDSIGGLRTLLVDIYPDTLESSGLIGVLRDLAATLRSRDIEVHLDVPDTDPGLGADLDRIVFRIAHECLANVRRHSSARNAWVTLAVAPDQVVLEIADDGVGFDPQVTVDDPEQGHFGLRVLADVASAGGGVLAVASAPGAGCRYLLTVARP